MPRRRRRASPLSLLLALICGVTLLPLDATAQPARAKVDLAENATADAPADDAEEDAEEAIPQTTPLDGTPFDKANDEEKAASKAAVIAGKKAMKSQIASVALARFRESYGIVKRPDTHLLIVKALAALNRNAEAYTEARALVREADQATLIAEKFKVVSVGAREQVAELQPKVGLLRLTLPAGDGGLTIAGRAIDPAVWTQPVAADPGDVEIVYENDAGVSRQTVSATAGQETAVSVVAPVAKPAGPVSEDTGSGYDGPNRLWMAIGAGGVGVAGLTLFGVLGAVSQGQYDRLESACDDPDFCNPDFEEIAERGASLQTGANVSLVIGLVGLGAGAGLFTWDLLDPAADSAEASLRPRVTVGAGSVHLRGSF